MASTAESEVPQDLLDRAMQLPSESRERFGKLLLDSVAESAESRELIRERIAELSDPSTQLLEPEEVFAAIRQRVSEIRGQ